MNLLPGPLCSGHPPPHNLQFSQVPAPFTSFPTMHIRCHRDSALWKIGPKSSRLDTTWTSNNPHRIFRRTQPHSPPPPSHPPTHSPTSAPNHHLWCLHSLGFPKMPIDRGSQGTPSCGDLCQTYPSCQSPSENQSCVIHRKLDPPINHIYT